MPESQPKRGTVKTAQLAVVGTEMFGFATVGVLIDFALGTIHAIPWATLILGPLGLLAGTVHLIQMVKQRPRS